MNQKKTISLLVAAAVGTVATSASAATSHSSKHHHYHDDNFDISHFQKPFVPKITIDSSNGTKEIIYPVGTPDNHSAHKVIINQDGTQSQIDLNSVGAREQNQPDVNENRNKNHSQVSNRRKNNRKPIQNPKENFGNELDTDLSGFEEVGVVDAAPLAEPNVQSIESNTQINKNSGNKNQTRKTVSDMVREHNESVQMNTQNTLSSMDNSGVVHLSDIRATNLKNVRPEIMLNVIGLQKGSRYTESDNKEIENRLKQTGFFKNVEAKLDGDVLTVEVEENPTINYVKINGAKTINAKNIERQLNSANIGKYGVLNQKMLNIFVNKLKNDYADLGKENAQIQLNAVQSDNNEVGLVLNVEEGETSYVNDIQFSGNTVYSSSELKRKMNTNKNTFFNRITGSGKFKPNQVHDDLNHILDQYKSNGYANAEIADVSITESDNHQKNIHIVIKEGDKYYFGKPEFVVGEETSSAISPETLDKLNQVQPNNVFNKFKLLGTQSAIKTYLANKGYPFANVDITFKEENDDGKRIFIPQFMVSANRQATIRNITISGANKTKTDTIRKEIRQKSGELYNQQKIVDTDIKLRQTGMYNDVNIETKPVLDENGNLTAVDLNVNVDERRTGSASINAGYSQGYGVSFGASVSDRNAFGTGKTMGADISIGKPQQDISLQYSDPHLFGIDKNLDVGIYGSRLDTAKLHNNSSHYKLERFGINGAIGIPLSTWNKIYLGLGVEHLNLKTSAISPIQYRDFVNKYGNGSGNFKGVIPKIRLSWGRNTTTDAYWGGSGYIANVGLEASLPPTKVRYYKGSASYKHFFPIGQNATLSIHGQFGIGNGYGRNKGLPFFNNFQGGGISDVPVRAFESGTIGAKVYNRDGEIIGLGGNKMVAASVELNSKIPFTKDSSNMRIGAFIDAASIWDGKNYTVASNDNGRSVYRQNNYKSTMSSELRVAAGLAWTWHSPVGAIKLSYGVPIRKRDGDQVQRFQFTLGKVF